MKPTTEDLLRQQLAPSTKGRSKVTSSINFKASTKPKKIKPKTLSYKTLQWPQLPQPPNPKLLSPTPGKKGKGNVLSELLKEKPITRKATLVHEEVISSRDAIFEVSTCML